MTIILCLRSGYCRRLSMFDNYLSSPNFFTLYFSFLFLLFSSFKQNQIQNILTFFHFLYHINHFLPQNKNFLLFYKTYPNFLIFLSHQSLLRTIQTKISQHKYLPNILSQKMNIYIYIHTR
jgi:hypothetical protein